MLSALVSGALALAGIAAGSIVTAESAQAAAGDPFPAADPLVFVAQNQPTGLFKAVTDSTGTVSFQAEGPASAITYNSIAYNTANNYLYGIVSVGNAAFPTGSLIRIGQLGAITRVGTNTFPSVNAAAFGADGLFYITSSAAGYRTLTGINVTTGVAARTVTLTQPPLSADITFANGFFWGHAVGNGSAQITRINPANGAVAYFPAPFFINGATDFSGAAWTFGNGNLGFSQNASGRVTQVAVTNPGSANPTFTRISVSPGPASGNNDGAGSPGQPTDLAIAKQGPVALIPGGTVSYTITVTNNGAGNSSGFTVSDVVPAPLTDVASPTPGCTVAGNTVTCVGGRTLAGQSTQFTITARVPADLAAPVTNTATVTANEADNIPANNTASTTGTPAALSLVKHAGTPVDTNADGIVDADDTIQYTFTVTNTGLLPLNGVAVSDPKVGSVTCPTTPLAPGANMTCSADAPYTITDADEASGGVDNVAVASATPQGTTDTVTSSPATTHTPTTAPAPSISLVKSGSPSDAASYIAGQVITYSFVVTNTGNVPLTDVTIDDSDFSGTGTPSAIDCPAEITPLDPDEQVICTMQYELTGADIVAGQVTNSATVTGTPPDGGTPVTSTPSSARIPILAAPALELEKSVSPETAHAAGDTVIYSFAVTNTGNVPVSDPVIDETAFSGASEPVATCPTGTFLPGQTVACTASYELTQSDVDAGTVTNTAVATATAASGTDPESAPSSAAVTIPAAPGLTIVKDSTVAGAGSAGDIVEYSFLVTNTGNVTLTGISVTEGSFSGTGSLSAITCPVTTLAPGDDTTCTASYTLTQADVDAGQLTNTATATGTPPGGGTPPVSPPSEETTPLPRTAALSLVKSVTPTTVARAGDTVTYEFLVTNTGNVTLDDPIVNETAFSGTGTITVVCPPDTSLAPTQSVTCEADYTVTQADIDAGTITNTATATATPPAGVDTPVSDPSDAEVTATAAPAITLVKSADVSTVDAVGDTIVYAFLVTNTGNVTLSDITIVEDAFSGTGATPVALCPQATLAPGADQTCTASYAVTQDDLDAGTITNTARATGLPPASTTPVASAPSPASVTATQTPGLSVVKSASPSAPADFHAGETITYSFVVTNTGNVTMEGISITEVDFTGSDPLPTPTCPAAAASLAPGAQVTCETTYIVTQADIDAGSITNTATAGGTPPGSTTTVPSAPSTVTVPEPANPALTVVKSADTATITEAGQRISYAFLVTNTGNTTLSDIAIDEASFSGAGELSAIECPSDPASLIPGQQVTCTASYTVVAADLTGQPLSNTATASATPPGGTPVTSDPSTARVVTQAPELPGDDLAATGWALGGSGAAALALLIGGGVLLFLRKRRAA